MNENPPNVLAEPLSATYDLSLALEVRLLSHERFLELVGEGGLASRVRSGLARALTEQTMLRAEVEALRGALDAVLRATPATDYSVEGKTPYEVLFSQRNEVREIAMRVLGQIDD